MLLSTLIAGEKLKHPKTRTDPNWWNSLPTYEEAKVAVRHRNQLEQIKTTQSISFPKELGQLWNPAGTGEVESLNKGTVSPSSCVRH